MGNLGNINSTTSIVESSEKGAANGVAELDAGGKIPAAQLPATVGDFLANGTVPMTGPIDIAKLTAPVYAEGRVWYDTDKKALSYYNDESDSSNQIGFETWVRVHNLTGGTGTILNGQVCFINGYDATADLPTVELANALNLTTSEAVVGVATHDIEDNSSGVLVNMGTLGGYDTATPEGASWISGDVLWLSTTDGGLTKTRPIAPGVSIRIGIVGKVHATEGTIEIHIEHHDLYKGTNEYFNGAVLESPALTITEAGGTVSANLERSGGGDLTLMFNGIFVDLDCTPPKTVALTAGTDAAPTLNYIYILESAPTVLAVSTTSFPSAQHVPIGTVLVQSATGSTQSVDTVGAYKVHAWTDHITDSLKQGHGAHLNAWIRNQPATWQSGVSPIGAATSTPSVLNYSLPIGVILQLHNHNFPAINTAVAGVPNAIYYANHPTTAFKKYDTVLPINATNLTVDAASNALTGKSYNVVLWGVVNEASNDCKLMMNYPVGVYNNGAAAIADADDYTVYAIPEAYKGVGFLIAKVTISEAGGGDYSIEQTEDLRGLFPSTSAGGGPTGITTVANDAIWDTAGDMVYATGANAAVKLPIGTANQSLKTNAGATAPEWVTERSSVDIDAQDYIISGSGTAWYVTGNIRELNHEGTVEGQYFYQSIIPDNYKSGAELAIWIESSDLTPQLFTVDVYINGTIDATISATSLAPGVVDTWELKTLTFGSAVSPGDIVDIKIRSDNTGANYNAWRNFQINFNI